MKEVFSVSHDELKLWLLKKHYAHRIPSISYGFGLYIDKELVGVCCFGYPPNYNYNNGTCIFNNYRCLTLELNRLIVNDGLPPNTLSWFVSTGLRLLPTPSCIGSYADPNNNHYGYIYQATNWTYTGESTPKHKYIFESGEEYDVRRGIDKKGIVVGKEKIKPTLRYLYFNGNKREKKQMFRDLKMTPCPYPKGESKRYDAGGKITTQTVLF